MFTLKGAERAQPEEQLAGLQVSGLPLGGGVEKFEMTMAVAETADGSSIGGELSYRQDRFSTVSMQRMVDQWQNLLAAIVEQPQQPTEQYPILAGEERRKVLEHWGGSRESVGELGWRSVVEMFEDQVEEAGERIAVESGEQRLSYAELNVRSNQLAHYLRGCGVGAETRVGLCCERSLELVVGMLGILKAGGVYVPLDANFPQERLCWMFEDAELAVLLTAQGKEKQLPQGSQVRLRLDEQWERVEAASAGNPVPLSGANNLAYIIYTSGSTGQPKGVGVEHRGIVRLVKETNFFTVTRDDAFLQFCSVNFDVSTFEIWGALSNGARLVMAPAASPTLDELGQVIEQSGVTAMWLTSGVFQQMVETQLGRMRGVRQFLAGGDIVPLSHVRQVVQAQPECVMVNGYGPTENTTFTTCYRCQGDPGDSFPIGKAICNTTVYVLDEGMQALPVGLTGELYTGGKGLARGYLGQAHLTGEKFVPNPFSRRGGERLYRTGDLVRWREDGNLEFLGRGDQQVKVRGYRIELGEIEATLLSCRGVQQAVVVARQDRAGDKRLVGYVVAQPEDSGVTEDALRRYLQSRLPEYMVPVTIVQLVELPLSGSGKVDRKKLQAMAGEFVEKMSHAYEGPKDAREEILCGMWSEVLGRERVGVGDNFFELGGHSLLAMQLISRVRRVFAVELPLRSLFEAPTVRALAERLLTCAPGSQEAPALTGQGATNVEILTGLETLSDAEVEMLLYLEKDEDAKIPRQNR
jgi:amino acid adenylation domain-containing protein